MASATNGLRSPVVPNVVTRTLDTLELRSLPLALLDVTLTVDAHGSQRLRLQSPRWNVFPTLRARTVFPVVQSIERLLDLDHPVDQNALERLFSLRSLRRNTVALDRFAQCVLHHHSCLYCDLG